MTPKKSNTPLYITMVIMAVIFSTVFALHYARIESMLLGLSSTADSLEIATSYHSLIGHNYTWLNISLSAMTEMFSHPFYMNGLSISLLPKPWATSLFISLFALFLEYLRQKVAYQTAPGKEHGSSAWFTDYKKYNKQFRTPWTKNDQQLGIPDPNMIIGALPMKAKVPLSKKVEQEPLEGSLTGDGLKVENKRNANVLVIGGSGSGKTFRMIKPNVMQMNCSMVITDPSGEIMRCTGVPLMENGYKMKLFSTSDMLHSNVYNPFDYIYEENGEIDETKVKVMVSTFMKNADQSGKKGGDPFWDKAATAWLTFAVFFLAEFFDPLDRNMYNVLKLAQAGKSEEDSSSSETQLDKIVKIRRAQNPNAKCFVSYDTFKLAPAKTANSILITLGVNLEPFGSAEKVKNMTTTSYLCKRNKNGEITDYILDRNGNYIRDENNLDLHKIGDEKTVLYINIPQANGAYNFLVSMMYSQMFDALYARAEKISPNSYHIFNQRKEALASCFQSEDAAKRFLELASNAEIKEDGGKTYLYNKAMTKKDLELFVTNGLPNRAYMKGGVGYLKEVYNKKIGAQLIQQYKMAKINHGSEKLAVPVRCLLDEFANIGEIPDFDKLLATMRKYQISCTIVLQSLAQLKAKYDKLWEGIVGNCDTIVFLGSSENETCKYISEKLGKTTIRTRSTSESKGRSGSYSTSSQNSARDLMDPAEVSKIDNNYSIVIIRGLQPFYVPKYNFLKHPNYGLTGDADMTRQVSNEYLEKHFRCLTKTEATVREVQEQNKKDDATINHGQNPDGRNKTTVKKPKRMKNGKDLAEGTGAKDTSPEEMAKAMKSCAPDDLKTDDSPDEPNPDSAMFQGSTPQDTSGSSDDEPQGDSWLFPSD